MAESYDLYFYAGQGIDAHAAGRALAQSVSAGRPAQAPTSASLSPGRLAQLAGDVAAAVPETEQAPAEEAPPGSQLLQWPEFPHGQLELHRSHARFGIRGTSVRGGSVLANWHARLVGAAPLLTQAGFDTIYDAELDRVISLPEDWPEVNLNWWTFYCGPPTPPRPPERSVDCSGRRIHRRSFRCP
ncbi:MAG: hypothetical protein JHD16_09095 [Solirubrobacteraceae bacterium]|nr:hypothetical protein [Solirubrobacteraceae bacterium]